LWQLLQQAAHVVAAVQGGASSAAVLDAAPPQVRAGAQALAYAGLRHLGRAQALRKLLAKRTPPPRVDAVLITVLGLLTAQHAGEAPRYDAFTLVNQAVEAIKHHPDTRAQAAFVNACLRRYLREQSVLEQAVALDPVARWNHPLWWVKRLRADHPQHWQHILTANNHPGPLTLRVNLTRWSLEQAQNAICKIAECERLNSESGLILRQSLPVQHIPGFVQGRVSVQDAAAQRAGPLLLGGLSDLSRLRVLDACAAPGGKTAHLLELGVGHVTALDIDPGRCQRIEQNLQRLQLANPGRVRVTAADAAAPEAWWEGQPFDAILLDAPCTASGIVRRHPDVRWLRREADIDALAVKQAQLLRALWPLVRPGGRLLYCTCSVFLAEGQGQIQTFLAHNRDASLLPSPGQLLPRNGAFAQAVPDNRTDDHDGFFLALLQKAPA
jgi:16S rRNA (cytosine967-C5)-methyltransferase